MTHGFCNERVDSNWALRILSGHSFAVETDHDGPPDRDDAGQLPLWRKWLAENRAALPRRCSLIDPFRPAKEIARIPIAACAEHISVDRHLLFVGGRTYLEVFDISDVTRPERIGEYRVDEQGVEQIAATAGRLFLTTHAGTLHVYGYTDQGDLRLISTHSEVRYGAHFMVSARRLLVSNHLYQRNAQAALYDLTGSGAPRLLHVCDASTLQPFSFSGENGFYTTARWDADRISTEGCFPMATVQRSVWPNGAVTADDRWFYCLDHGLLVIRDLRTGRLLGTAPARAPYDGTICVRDKRVFALLESMGMVVYDVFEPSNPKVLSHTPLPGQPGKIYRGLSISGDYLFCANYEGDLLIFEFPEPLKKREME
jgi:hypothetical protein